MSRAPFAARAGLALFASRKRAANVPGCAEWTFVNEPGIRMEYNIHVQPHSLAVHHNRHREARERPVPLDPVDGRRSVLAHQQNCNKLKTQGYLEGRQVFQIFH